MTELWDCLQHWRHTGAAARGVPVALTLAVRLLRLGLLDDALRILREVEIYSVFPKHQAATLTLLAQAARTQRDWDSVARLCERWDSFHSKHNMVQQRHGHFELLRAEAMFYSQDTVGEIPPYLVRCVSSGTASSSHRIAAGFLAMRAAHNAGDPALAVTVFDAVRDLRGSSRIPRIRRLMIEGIYQGSFGSVDRACASLEEAVRIAGSLRHEIARHVLIRQACFGLRRYGNAADAEALLLESLAVFRRFSLLSQALVCVEQLGQSAAWEGRFDEAFRWITESASLAPSVREFIARAIEDSLRTILAFEAWDPELLAAGGQEDAYAGASPKLRRVHQQTLSSKTAKLLLLGEKPLDETIATLTTLHSHMRTQSDQDFPTAVLASALADMGRSDDAKTLVEGYLAEHRREATPLIPSLRRTIGRLGCAVPEARNRSELGYSLGSPRVDSKANV